MYWLLAFLAIGATYRLSRLVTADYVTKPLRTAVNRRYGDNRLSYFVTCDWCVSFWVSWPVAFAAIWWPTNRLVWIVLLALTASAITGLAASRLEGE
jgi:hypothetical protein